MKRIAWMAALATTVALGTAGVAVAHPHKAEPSGQVIANGQNHPAFPGGAGTSCEEFGPASGGPIGPAWYGLETAHHGPDAATPGKSDGCYQTTGNVAPGLDDENPALG